MLRVTHLDFGREMRGGQYQVLGLFEELKRLGVEQRLLGPHGEPFAVRKVREGLVHAHDAKSHTWAAVAANGPLIVSRRVAFPVKRTWLSRWKYRQPALFIAVSKYVASKLIESGVPTSKIAVVYDGVPALAPSTRTGPLIAPRTEDPMKGSDLIRAAGAGIEFVDDLREALRTASGLVYITREEGLGSAALLAMSAGVPVVASRVGGLPEIVEHERTGLLVDNDPHAIAAAAGRLRTDDAAEWTARGRELVHGKFLMSHTAAATLALYRTVI
ncbi:MAG: glycosyltransferase family 4 protein [Acidobacteria bacterium]|nr:glycosyltransferase family 4 protein [Acidobacteriota bacterium]